MNSFFLQYHEEIPYSCTVEVIQYEERDNLDYINAEVIVNRASQKGMIIGKGGKSIKQLGSKSRESIEAFIEKKVFLDLHVKVRKSGGKKKARSVILDTIVRKCKAGKSQFLQEPKVLPHPLVPAT